MRETTVPEQGAILDTKPSATKEHHRLAPTVPVGARPTDDPFAPTSSTMPPPLPGDIPCKSTPHDLSIEILTSPEELQSQVGAWSDLYEHALEPNVFYSPESLLPALKTLIAKGDFHFLIVRGHKRGTAAPETTWTGFFPFASRSRFHGLPLRNLALVHHDYCFLRTPLVRGDFAEETLGLVLQWSADQKNVMAVELADQNGDGPYYELLVRTLQRLGIRPWVYSIQSRAILRRERDGEEYLRSAVSGGKLKELRRLERRLAELGKLRYESLSPDGDVDRALDEFLDLERRGWKGNQGTAMACRGADGEFFREMTRSLFERGRLRMLALRLGERLVAAKCNLLASPGSFAFKIAFDPEFSRFSPGVQLEIDNIRRFHAEPDLRWMDSCADPNHPMIDHLWSGQRVIQSMILPTSRTGSDLAIGIAPLLASLRRRWSRRT